MDAFQRVVQRQRKQLRVFGWLLIGLGAFMLVLGVADPALSDAAGGVVRTVIAGLVGLGAGVSALWRSRG